MSFKESIKIGKLGEQLVRDKLKEIGIDSEDSADKGIDFFLILDGTKYSCEVKYDLYSLKSQNWAIEIYNTKLCKPSGITSTKCHLWFQAQNKDNIYFSLVHSLREFVKTEKPKRMITDAGDGNAALNLYSIEHMKKVFLNLTKENIEGVLNASQV
jgi:hypothetical protein